MRHGTWGNVSSLSSHRQTIKQTQRKTETNQQPNTKQTTDKHTANHRQTNTKQLVGFLGNLATTTTKQM